MLKLHFFVKMSTNSYKIDSPFAQFNGSLLSCKLCNCQVKSVKVWTAHVNGKQHREKLLELKTRKLDAEVFKIPAKRNVPLPTDANKAKKSKISKNGDEKQTGVKLPEDFFDASFQLEVNKVEGATPTTSGKKKDLHRPAFKEKPSANGQSSSVGEPKSSPDNDKDNFGASSSTSIPEGFFDDKKLDAKARNVELKDPLDDEWQKFQKEMQQVQTVTDSIVEEDEERLNMERTLDEIDDEIRCWARLNELEKKVEKIVVPSETETPRRNESAVSVDIDGNDSSSEDITLEEMMDWRSKQLWK